MVIGTTVEGLRLAGEMGWETWWALVLGFTIAGAVETFVSEEKMSEGGTAPSGHTIYLNSVFFVYIVQVYVGYLGSSDGDKVDTQGG